MKNLIIVFVLIVSVLSCKNETKHSEINEHKNHVTTSDKDDVLKKKVLSHIRLQWK